VYTTKQGLFRSRLLASASLLLKSLFHCFSSLFTNSYQVKGNATDLKLFSAETLIITKALVEVSSRLQMGYLNKNRDNIRHKLRMCKVSAEEFSRLNFQVWCYKFDATSLKLMGSTWGYVNWGDARVRKGCKPYHVNPFDSIICKTI